MKLSICIPTYNRARHLSNCLHSIISNNLRERLDFQLCVSDNASDDETEDVVHAAQQHLEIKYHKNESNLGVARNVMNVVQMADGEFVWLIGDDDLLLPDALQRLCELLGKHQSVDYYYVNAFHLTTEFVLSFPQPFDTGLLPENMEPFSSRKESSEMFFMDLIDPKVSFDFLGGMFLAVFRREKWNANIAEVDSGALADSRVFSHFDNTFVHVKIFAKAFADSRAYFSSEPFSVCLTGAREWAPMYPFIRTVRLVEALDEYRKNGLPYLRYLKCKNFNLRYFIPDLVSMFLNKSISGYVYVNPLKLIAGSLLYPNAYLSLFYYLVRKVRGMVGLSVR
jgi:glycosyltransferase involved in cell wall biosynthesis